MVKAKKTESTDTTTRGTPVWHWADPAALKVHRNSQRLVPPQPASAEGSGPASE